MDQRGRDEDDDEEEEAKEEEVEGSPPLLLLLLLLLEKMREISKAPTARTLLRTTGRGGSGGEGEEEEVEDADADGGDEDASSSFLNSSAHALKPQDSQYSTTINGTVPCEAADALAEGKEEDDGVAVEERAVAADVVVIIVVVDSPTLAFAARAESDAADAERGFAAATAAKRVRKPPTMLRARERSCGCALLSLF